MALDVRTAQTSLENTLRDTILFALGKRLNAVTTVAALRALPTAGASSTLRTDDDLINIVVTGVVVTAYRWSSVSTATDNGTSIIKPNDVATNGRWLSWESDVRFAPTVSGNSYYLHELLDGPLRRVIILDKQLNEEEINALILGQVPAVVVEASSDDPQDMQLATGWRYNTSYDFKISSIDENLRSRREAAQGASLLGDTNPGTNTIDGWIQSLIGGVGLVPAEDGIRNTMIGRGDNYSSQLGQRRVIRERAYKLLCTVENPPASNDSAEFTDLSLQAEMVDLHDQPAFDKNNYVASGIEVIVDTGLTQFVTVGSAFISGVEVPYAGEAYAFPAFSDVYRDLLPNGTITFVAVPLNGATPAITTNSLRIGVSQTNGTSVISDRFIAMTKEDYAAEFELPL